MQYNGIKGKSLKLQEGDALLEMRYDASSSDQTGAFISKDGGVSFEKLLGQSDGSILKPFTPNKQYVENEMIIEDGIIYTRKTAGISAATLGEDIANWELQTRLHTSGNRYVRFTSSSSGSGWSYNKSLTYVDGDQSLLASNYLLVPADGLYYLNYIPCLSTSSSSSTMSVASLVRKNNLGTTTSGIWDNLIGYNANYATAGAASVSGIYHLSKGDKVSFTVFSSGTLSGSATSEFGLLAEDQSDNLVCEAQIVNYTSLTTSETNMKLQDISNPSVLSSTGMITLPEDGSYFVNIDFMQSVSGGSSGIASTFVSNSTRTTRYLLGKIHDMSNGQIPSLSGIITGSKGEQFQISHSKTVAQSGLTYSSGYKRYVRIFKLKSVITSLSSQDLYNEYLQKLPASKTPNSYEDWLKSLVSRSQLRVKVKVVNQTRSTTGLIQHQFTYTEGEQSMLDSNNCFVAPVAGLYSISLPSFATTFSHGVSTPGTTTILKGTTNIDSAYLGFSCTNGTVTIPSCNPIVWLDKGETVSVWWNENTTDSITLLRNNYDSYVEFSLIQAGHPYIDYPNTWTPGVEYDFGNGLYGQRFTGTSTGNNYQHDVTVTTSGARPNIINWGGTIQISVSDLNKISANPGYMWSTSDYLLPGIVSILNKVRFQVSCSSGHANIPYDVWVKYTK